MFSIRPIAAFSDNYIWLLHDPDTRQAFVVDPGDAAPVLSTLQSLQLNLAGILLTHHHFDHVGGVAALCDAFSCTVYGPHNPAIEGVDQRLAAGDHIQVLGEDFEVLEVPGHTLDHIAFFHRGATPTLFCGDTLFAGGCGRVFEGNPPMMLQSLQQLAALPADTLVYCAHEYTLANLAFARAVEPQNNDLAQRQRDAEATRKQQQPTVPSTVALELATNPFLRCSEASVRASLSQQGMLAGESASEVFAAVRGWKDNF